MEDSKKPKNKRVKRQDNPIGENVDAVIQLTGGVLQSLFSVAYTDDVRKVVDRIDSIDADLKENINVVQNSQDSLKQRTVDSLSKQDNKMQMVEKMARTVERKVSHCFVGPINSKISLLGANYIKTKKHFTSVKKKDEKAEK